MLSKFSLGSITVTFNKKSLYKTLSWRAISIVQSYLIIFFVLHAGYTGATAAGWAVGISTIISTLTYYFHERFWARVRKNNWLKI